MKKLELKLKKDVLIVDAENCGYISDMSMMVLGGTIYNLPEGYELLCKGSELTEEIASELVETTWIHDKKILCKYKNYNSEGDGSYFSAVKSFISAVESKGFYWLENPIPEPNKYVQRCMSFENLSNQFKLFDEKEEKTFKNPLVFIKNE